MVFFNPFMLMEMDGVHCAFHYNKIAIVPYPKGRNYMDLTEVLGPIENSDPSHLQKAVLWGPESVLMDSVEILLKVEAAWDVVKISNDRGLDHLLQQAQTLKPKVVILCQEKEECDPNLLMELSQIRSCSKVVVVSLESNLMQVYGRHNIIMRDISDLLSVVDNEYFPNIQPKEEVQAAK